MNRRRWWGIGGAIVLVIVAAAVWFSVATIRPSTPDEAALAYLHALESGDADAVAATGIDVSATTLEAFADATAHIEEAEILGEKSDADDAAATVDVAFQLDGAPHRASLRLRTVDGRWIVADSGLGTLTAESSIGSAVAIGAATAPVQKPLVLLPAVYTVAAAPTALLDGESTVVMLPGEDTAVTIDAGVRPEATTAAQAQLDEHLQECTVPAGRVPAQCGIRIPWGTEFHDVSEIRYRIEASPVIALTSAGFSADGGVLIATVTGTGQDGAARTTTYRTESWSVRGEVSFTDDALVLSYR
ncbi:MULTISPECIES: hypothetical protein [unclassified Microbacterium]|uniref:hypothetical protein n=1 Tax=unclassified Microbacterium TaxID=2609290 RepID=UPI00301B507B